MGWGSPYGVKRPCTILSRALPDYLYYLSSTSSIKQQMMESHTASYSCEAVPYTGKRPLNLQHDYAYIKSYELSKNANAHY